VAPILNSPLREQEYFAKQKIIAQWINSEDHSRTNTTYRSVNNHDQQRKP